MSAIKVDWSCFCLSQMSSDQLFELLRMRQNIFIIEQSCIYSDIDDHDLSCWHLLGYGYNSELQAYCRLLKPQTIYKEAATGRVLVKEEYRRRGLARDLMLEAHRRCELIFKSSAVRLNAQVYLKEFYEDIGYRCVSGPYSEDGIMHVEMLRVE